METTTRNWTYLRREKDGRVTWNTYGCGCCSTGGDVDSIEKIQDVIEELEIALANARNIREAFQRGEG